jgi:hypothetical protein
MEAGPYIRGEIALIFTAERRAHGNIGRPFGMVSPQLAVHAAGLFHELSMVSPRFQTGVDGEDGWPRTLRAYGEVVASGG